MKTKTERADWLAEHVVLGGVVLGLAWGLGFFVLFGAMTGFRRPGFLLVLCLIGGLAFGAVIGAVNRKRVRDGQDPVD